MDQLPGPLGQAWTALDAAVETLLRAEPGERAEAARNLDAARHGMAAALRRVYGLRAGSSTANAS